MYKHMKIKYILSIVLLAGVIFTGCNEDEDGYKAGGDIEITEKLPEGIFEVEASNLSLSPATGTLTVSWNAPGNATDLNGYLVEWKGTVSDTKLYTQSVSKDKTSLTINRLYNESYQVTVKCISTGLLYSTGINANASPTHDNTPPGVAQNLSADPMAVTIFAQWVNPTDADLEMIIVSVTDVATNTVVLTSELQPFVTSYTFVGLNEKTEYKVSVVTQDYVGNNSAPVEKTVKTLTEVQLDKVATPWAVADFSSEEQTGEGANGKAAQAIDNDPNSYWHSQWKGGGSKLPQFVTFDIMQEVVPTTLIYFDRIENNPRGTTLAKVEGSLDNITWHDFGTFPADPLNQGAKSCPLYNVTKVRYIRFTVMTSNSAHAMIRNIELRALVQE
jgi:hypothetical protein